MELGECLRCMGHSVQYSTSAIIHVDSKPALEYQISKWLPDKVKVLFIGEAPPHFSSKKTRISDSYFYNEEESLRFFGPPAPLIGTLS